MFYVITFLYFWIYATFCKYLTQLGQLLGLAAHFKKSRSPRKKYLFATFSFEFLRVECKLFTFREAAPCKLSSVWLQFSFCYFRFWSPRFHWINEIKCLILTHSSNKHLMIVCVSAERRSDVNVLLMFCTMIMLQLIGSQLNLQHWFHISQFK